MSAPAKPKKLLILALALGAGLSLGSMLAFARDAFSRTFRDLADLKDWTNVPILAVLPAVSEADLYGTCDDEGATLDTLISRTDAKRGTLQRVLEGLVGDGTLTRSGKGAKGDPLRWHRKAGAE